MIEKTSKKLERTIQNSKILYLGCFLFLLLGLFTAKSVSAIANQISFQGKLTDSSGSLVTDGTYYLKFSIYDSSSGGTCQYTAAGSCGSATTTPVTLTSGIFSVNLGDTDNGINALASNLFNADALYLGITVCSGPNTGCDAEMTPRKRITAAPYAFNADRLSGLTTSTQGGDSSYVPVTDSSGDLRLSNSLFLATSTAGQLGIGTSTVPTGYKAYLESTTAADKLLVIRANASQTGNLTEWQNSSGVSLLSIDPTGGIYTSGTLSIFGNLNRINNVAYTWPSSQGGANTYLKNDGSGGLTWATVTGGSSINDWGRFGETYGVSALMTSTSYPVWFDNEVYVSSTLITSGNATFNGELLSFATSSFYPFGKFFVRDEGPTGQSVAFLFNGSSANPAITLDAMNGVSFGNNSGSVGYLTIYNGFEEKMFLSPDIFKFGQETGFENGHFFVDSSGNISTSGTLAVYGGETFLQSSSPTGKPLIIRANANQTANLTEWQGSNGEELMSFATTTINDSHLALLTIGGTGRQGALFLKGDGFSQPPIFGLYNSQNTYFQAQYGTNGWYVSSDNGSTTSTLYVDGSEAGLY
ncbi:MAG TPA: hypothetical protein PKY08_02745, partial [Candidatus Magasanikbacteria bacterium]|nr:hypothetical protein [Candidatus Magasanikbacteria bacterium]